MKLSDLEPKLARYLSLLLAAMMALLPFHAFLTTWLAAKTGHADLVKIWKEIILAAMFLPVVWLALTTPPLRKWFWHSPLLWLIRAYLLLHLLLGWYALTHHRVNASAFIYALIINLRFLVILVIACILAAKADLLRRYWLKLLVVPASLVIVFGLAQRFILPYDFLKHFGYGPNTIPAYQTVDNNLNYRRIQSSLRGANPLGAYLLLVVPGWLAVRDRRLQLAGLAGSAIVLFFTYSRSAWIGLAATLLALLLWRPQVSRRFKQAAILSAAIVCLAAGLLFIFRHQPSVEDTLLHTSSASVNASSNAKRSAAIKRAAGEVAHQPLGRGPGTAGPASVRNAGHPPRIAENYYLQIAQEVGWLGLAIFLAINWLVLVELWRRRTETLAKLLLASYLGIAIVNLVSHAWADDTLALLWWGLAGIAIAPILGSRQKANGKTKAKKA